MAKLYAELTSDKGGRVVGKGGNDYIYIDISAKNLALMRLRLRESQTQYEKAEGEYVLEWTKKDVSKRLVIICKS